MTVKLDTLEGSYTNDHLFSFIEPIILPENAGLFHSFEPSFDFSYNLGKMSSRKLVNNCLFEMSEKL